MDFMDSINQIPSRIPMFSVVVGVDALFDVWANLNPISIRNKYAFL